MALIDNQLMYSDGQDVTVTADSTNKVDHGAAIDLGAGEDMYVLLQFGTVVSDATLAAKLQGDDDGAGTNLIDLAVAKTITPVSNSFYWFPIPSNKPRKVTRLNFTVAGGVGPHIPITATLVNGKQLRDFSRVY